MKQVFQSHMLTLRGEVGDCVYETERKKGVKEKFGEGQGRDDYLSERQILGRRWRRDSGIRYTL